MSRFKPIELDDARRALSIAGGHAAEARKSLRRGECDGAAKGLEMAWYHLGRAVAIGRPLSEPRPRLIGRSDRFAESLTALGAGVRACLRSRHAG